MSTLLSAVEGASSASWNQPNRTVHNRSWHHSLEDGDYKWSDCEAGHFSGVAVTLLTCSCGLLGNGAALWLLCSRACRSPITTYVLNLAIANSTFLLSITIALVMFYTPECLCCRLGSQDVGTVLNIIILFAFTASLYLLVAFSAMVTLSILPSSCCPCHGSWHLPVCALLWALSFILTMTLYLHPGAVVVFVLSYFFSVLALTISGLILLARVLCSSQQHPPRKLCVVVLIAVIFFPFLTADFWYWLLLRLFDFSVFVFDTSLLLACVNSTISPVIFFFLGSCANSFMFCGKASFQGGFEAVAESPKRSKAPRENPMETIL
ncbi:mas-related G-protein coupled receptor member D-like isoform X1 [Melanerpes formicivorus]|uniref:mas-related G-protein coupled receptor member D-like isoform X1 n=1 Tax=Melanerpes formicivorus TaxID=211600 RepID=UPI00358E5D41